jgi:hypothetical protein
MLFVETIAARCSPKASKSNIGSLWLVTSLEKTDAQENNRRSMTMHSFILKFLTATGEVLLMGALSATNCRDFTGL